MRSRLGIFSVLLLLTPTCFSTSCRTCKNEECFHKNVLVVSCNKNAPVLPFEVPLPKNKEHLQYGCLQLECLKGNSIEILQQCIITEDISGFCKAIAKSINIIQCNVNLPRENILKSDDPQTLDPNGDSSTTRAAHPSEEDDMESSGLGESIPDLTIVNDDSSSIVDPSAYDLIKDEPTTSYEFSKNQQLDEESTTVKPDTLDPFGDAPTTEAANSSEEDDIENSGLGGSTTDFTIVSEDSSSTAGPDAYDLITDEPTTSYEFSKNPKRDEDSTMVNPDTLDPLGDSSTNETANSSEEDDMESSGLGESTTNELTATNEFSNSNLSLEDLTTPQLVTSFSLHPKLEEDSTTIHPETLDSHGESSRTEAADSSDADDMEASGLGDSETDVTTTQVSYSSVVVDISTDISETDLTTILPYDLPSSVKPNSNEDLTTNEPTILPKSDLKGEEMTTTQLVNPFSKSSEYGDDSTTINPATLKVNGDSSTTQTADSAGVSHIESSDLSDSTADVSTSQITYLPVVALNTEESETDLTTVLPYDSTTIDPTTLDVNEDSTTQATDPSDANDMESSSLGESTDSSSMVESNSYDDLTTTEPTILTEFSKSDEDVEELTTTQIVNPITRNLESEEDSTTINPTTLDEIRDVSTTQATDPSDASDMQSSSLDESTDSSSKVESNSYEDLTITEPTILPELNKSDENVEELTTTQIVNPITRNLESEEDSTTPDITRDASTTPTAITSDTDDVESSGLDESTDSSSTSDSNSYEDLTTDKPTTPYEFSNSDLSLEDLTTTQLANPFTGNSEEDSSTTNTEVVDAYEELTTPAASNIENLEDSGTGETTESSISAPEPTETPNSVSKLGSSFIVYTLLIIISFLNLK